MVFGWVGNEVAGIEELFEEVFVDFAESGCGTGEIRGGGGWRWKESLAGSAGGEEEGAEEGQGEEEGAFVGLVPGRGLASGTTPAMEAIGFQGMEDSRVALLGVGGGGAGGGYLR